MNRFDHNHVRAQSIFYIINHDSLADRLIGALPFSPISPRVRSTLITQRVSNSHSYAMNSILFKKFSEMLIERGILIQDMDKTNPKPMATYKINDLDWNLFEMDKANGRYLELFVSKDEVKAFGIVTLINRAAILRFHILDKNTKWDEHWASIYRERVAHLNFVLFLAAKKIDTIAVPWDTIATEDQLSQRGRYYSKQKGQDWKGPVFGLVDRIRSGKMLAGADKEIIMENRNEWHYSFDPAAQFYVNVIPGFVFGVAFNATHKAEFSQREKELLGRLKNHEQLSDLEVVELFSGRLLYKSIASFAMMTRKPFVSQAMKTEEIILDIQHSMRDLSITRPVWLVGSTALYGAREGHDIDIAILGKMNRKDIIMRQAISAALSIKIAATGSFFNVPIIMMDLHMFSLLNDRLRHGIVYRITQGSVQAITENDSLEKFLQGDLAMNGHENLGGIDLTPAHMNVQTQNSNGGIKFYLNPAMLAQLRNAPGLIPVIIKMQPLKNLKAFLETSN